MRYFAIVCASLYSGRSLSPCQLRTIVQPRNVRVPIPLRPTAMSRVSTPSSRKPRSISMALRTTLALKAPARPRSPAMATSATLRTSGRSCMSAYWRVSSEKVARSVIISIMSPAYGRSASMRAWLRRIASVHNTRKITKAMEMVAAAKLRRNQARIEALRPYAGDMIEMMTDLATFSEETRQYVLMQERPEVRSVALVAMAGDRGLAGAFNANVVRKAMEIERGLREDGVETRLIAVGRKGIGTLTFRGCTMVRSWQGLSDRPEYSDAQTIAKYLIELYTSGEVDRVRLVYNHFTSPIEQTLLDDSILPVPREAVTDKERRPGPVAYLYEPDPLVILESLLPAYVEIAVYRSLLESSASEQGAVDGDLHVGRQQALEDDQRVGLVEIRHGARPPLLVGDRLTWYRQDAIVQKRLLDRRREVVVDEPHAVDLAGGVQLDEVLRDRLRVAVLGPVAQPLPAAHHRAAAERESADSLATDGDEPRLDAVLAQAALDLHGLAHHVGVEGAGETAVARHGDERGLREDGV